MLKDLVLPSEEIPLPGGNKFSVRGISLSDILIIVQKYDKDISGLFSHYGSMLSSGVDNGVGLGLDLLAKSPEVAAFIIACAADDPSDEALSVVSALPAPVQIDALEKIGKLTFQASGGPVKTLEMVIRVMQGTSRTLEQIRNSTIG